jgi:hypothetical protein
VLTTEQIHRVLRRAQADPVWWVREILGDEPWQKQIEILEAVRDHERVAVASCHGAGKSWVAARIALWFLFSHPGSIVATTAPTFRQVRNVLWQEIRWAYRRARVPLGGNLLQTELRLDDRWFAFGFATDDPDRFQGLHAEHLLVVVDEAAGIDEEIWTAIEGVLTSAHVRLLAIGNPSGPSGRFYDLFRTPGVAKIHISAFDTPNLQAGGIVIPGLITPDWVEDKRQRWGEGSPLYQSRVLGRFPEASADALIPLSWVQAAQERSLEPGGPVVLGVDVARFGTDETVIYVRRGPVARLVHAGAQEDTMQTTGRVVRALAETGATRAQVDAVGIGAGVVDRLREMGKPVVEMQASEAASDPERFANRRAEWYWALRERFEAGEIDLDPADEVLAAQLTAIKYRIDSRGRIVIESKDEMKRRGLPSPDRADALALAWAAPRVSSPAIAAIDLQDISAVYGPERRREQ